MLENTIYHLNKVKRFIKNEDFYVVKVPKGFSAQEVKIMGCKEYGNVQGFKTIKCSKAKVKELKEQGFEVYKSPEFKAHSFLAPSQATIKTTYDACELLGATDDFKYKGKNILICIIDTGVCKEHAQLRDEHNITRVIYEKNYAPKTEPLNHYTGDNSPEDHNDHGTWCATAAAGKKLVTKNNILKGVAPEAYVANLKVFDKYGRGFFQAIASAFDDSKNLKNVLIARGYDIKKVIVSFSGGADGCFKPLHEVLETIFKSGVIVTVSAGNENGFMGTICCPAHDENVISVGSVAMETPHHGYVADFSSRGTPDSGQPVCVAYGGSWSSSGNEKVISGVSKHTHNGDIEASEGLAGTSMSNPEVAGICACLAEKNPELNQVKMKSKIINICKQVEYEELKDGEFSFASGYGIPVLTDKNVEEKPEVPEELFSISVSINGENITSYTTDKKHFHLEITPIGD